MKARCVLLWLLCAAMGMAAEVRKAVTFAELPAAVQKTIATQAGNGKRGEIERVEEDGEVSYEAEIVKDGRERDIAVGEDGTLQSIEVALIETPLVVLKTIEAQVGDGKIESIDKTFDDEDISYEVEMKTTDGAARSFTVAADGKLESVQVALEETPAAVQKTIAAQVGKATLGDVFKTFDDDGISYDATVTEKGRDRDFTVAENGRLVSRQVFLAELPPPAQKTIAESIGNGKVLRIDHVFEKKKGVFPFEIEGRRDGQAFDFSVGPKGAFLGMDD